MILRYFLACLAAFWLPLTSIHSFELVRDGAAAAKIYLAMGENSPELLMAVEDFKEHVVRMSGAELEVVRTEELPDGKEHSLVVGSLAIQAGASLKETEWKEGYAITVGPDRTLVVGETPQATGYAIYHLLNMIGCDWVMPGPMGDVIPQEKSITLPEGLHTSAPDFGYRIFWCRGGRAIVTEEEQAEWDQWTRRMRLGSAERFARYGQGHVWDRIIEDHIDEFMADPSMYALVQKPDGTFVREGPQVETTHPRVLELAIERIRRIFLERGWPNDKQVTLPMGPADGEGYSVSPESRAISPNRPDPLAGGLDSTDLVVDFLNRILTAVGEEFPNLSLGFYVYSQHADFPALHRPNPRIAPEFAPITYSRLHSTRDPNSKTRRFYKNILEQWNALREEQGGAFTAYEYNWNLADNMLPFTRVRMLAEDIAMYHEMGFNGIRLECTKAAAINAPGDYIAARMLWNADADWRKLLKEYCQKAFGSAAPMLENYYLRLAETQHESGHEAGSYFAAPLIFDAEFIKAAEEDFEIAMQQNLSDLERDRVAAAAYPLSVLKRYLAWNESIGQLDFVNAKKEYDAILAEWQVQLDKNSQLVAREVPKYMQGLMNRTTELGRKYSTAPYRVIYPIPDKLKTAFDPTGRGEDFGLAALEINDSDWIQTRTFSSTWDAQGLGLYREGSVWYRERLEIPKDLEEEPIGVFIGGAEDEAVVYLNGEIVGRSGPKFANPAVYDLTPFVRFGEENLLAIQVIRNSQVNENLLGGLLRPSFVFSGPQIENPTQQAQPKSRILPGGGREEL